MVPLLLFVVTHALLLGVLYLFLSQYGLSRSTFAVAAIVYLLASLLSGYVILSDIIELQEGQDKRLSHMVREVLHEINLPISTIEANISMLSKGLEGGKASKRLGRIHSSLARLKRLYAELSYSIQKEIMPIDKEPIALHALIEERVENMRELGRNTFALRLDEVQIEVDKIGLEQAVDNILENAMKYSDPKAPIEVTLTGHRLHIQDQGVGMDAHQILHIYEKYYQGDKSAAGDGIGLALVKRYCDESGIGIKIISTPEEGTEVILDFVQTQIV